MRSCWCNIPAIYFDVCNLVKVKVKVWTLAIAPLTWVGLVSSSALQSRKWWQLIGWGEGEMLGYLPVRPYVCCQTCEAVNMIFWKRMNPFWCKSAQVVRTTRTWSKQLCGSGQRSKLKVTRGRRLIRWRHCQPPSLCRVGFLVLV